MERWLSDKHRSTPLPGKTRPKLEISICLCLIRLNKILRIHLYPLRKKQLDGKASEKSGLRLFQLRPNKSYKISLCLCLWGHSFIIGQHMPLISPLFLYGGSVSLPHGTWHHQNMLHSSFMARLNFSNRYPL